VGEVVYNLPPPHSSLRKRPEKMKLREDKPRISEPSQIDEAVFSNCVAVKVLGCEGEVVYRSVPRYSVRDILQIKTLLDRKQIP
jgi:hypothetical protein